MRVLIVTKSFVREVREFIRYTAAAYPSLEFALVMPYCPENFPLPVTVPTLYFTEHIRASVYAPTFLRLFTAFRPDIVHIFEEYSGLLAFECTLLRDILCRNSRIMVYSAENLRGNVHPVFRLPAKYVMARAALAFVCSHTVERILAQEEFAHPIHVFPLGVDTSTFYKFPVDDLKQKLQLDGKFVLGYIDRLLRIKGVSFLIEMMRHLPEQVHLLIVGSGPEKQHLQQQIAAFHLEHRVRLVGEVPYVELPRYMNCMDAGILPSRTTRRWQEQFGRVLVEFMSCEVPVIGSDSGSIPEVLDKTGLTFREKDVQELVERVTMLMNNPEKRGEYGSAGRTRAQQHYSIEVMCQKFLTMYQQLNKGDDCKLEIIEQNT